MFSEERAFAIYKAVLDPSEDYPEFCKEDDLKCTYRSRLSPDGKHILVHKKNRDENLRTEDTISFFDFSKGELSTERR